MALDFLSADVITEEVQGRSSQIPNASTSAFAMAGYSPRGPEDRAIISTSFQEFVANFGGFSTKSYNGYAAAAYFQNGGNRLIFVRKLHSDATAASGSISSNWSIVASGRGIWANNAVVVLSGNQNFYDPSSGTYSAFDLSISLIDSTTGMLSLSESYEALNLSDSSDSSYISNVVNSESEDVVISALSGGIPLALQPKTHLGASVGTGVLNQHSYSISLSHSPVLPGSVKIYIDSSAVAVDDGQGNIVASGSSSVSGAISYSSGAVTFYISPALGGGEAITADYVEAASSSISVTLSGGADGSAVISSDLTSAALQASKQGIYAFDDVIEQFSLALPDFAGDMATDSALIGYAEGRTDVVALLTPPRGVNPQQAANYKRNTLKSISSYAASYYPWIKVPDALNKNRAKLIPPVGHVAGRFAYTDLNSNVGKAPAGTSRGQLNYILGLERSISKTERDIVYQAQINPIRSDADVGTAIWGNKTLQVVGDFTDVNIRRLFIYLRKTQEVGLLDIVFEDIGDTTFGIIKARLESFLEGLYLNNVIGSGVTNKAQAFKVVCDQSNNPAPIQQSKRIVIDEYIKPNLAAEVIHLRLQRVFDASQT